MLGPEGGGDRLPESFIVKSEEELAGDIATTAEQVERANNDDGKCSACGHESREGARFCANCRATFLSDAEIAALKAKSEKAVE